MIIFGLNSQQIQNIITVMGGKAFSLQPFDLVKINAHQTAMPHFGIICPAILIIMAIARRHHHELPSVSIITHVTNQHRGILQER